MKILLKSLFRENPAIFFFILAFLFGFAVCWVCYYICHRIFFKLHQINKNLLYIYCTFGATVWGIVTINSIDESGILLAACLFNFCITFVIFIFVKFILIPLPIEVYETKKNFIAIRLLKVFFIISFAIDLLLVILVIHECSFSFSEFVDFVVKGFIIAMFPFLVLWGISYVAFGNANPFFVFKYKPNKIQKRNDDEYIDTEIVQ